MITKSPKILYLLLVLILIVAGDAWRRSWKSNDVSVNQAVSPLRKKIIDVNRELSKIKNLWSEQRAITKKLELQIKKYNELAVKQSEKTLNLINSDENKLLDDLVNGIVAKNNNKIEKRSEEIIAFAQTEPEIIKIAEAKPETKPEVKPEVKPEAKPEVKPEVKPEIIKIAEAKPETKPEIIKIAETQVETTTETGKNIAKPVPLKLNDNKNSRKLPQLIRVTSLPANTAVPEIVIPDKDPNLTSKTIAEKGDEKINAVTSLSQTMLSGNKKGIKMTISDVLESYND